jgi:YhcN/YlaJ family sporulation lipoprotein
MKRSRILFGVVLLFLVAGLCFAGGCRIEREPARSPAPTSPVTPAPERKPMPTDPRETSRLADSLASEAREVEGVQRATIVLAGNTCYVGLDLKDGVERQQTNRVMEQVAERLKKTEPRLERVMVSTDPDVFTRLQRIASGIEEGRPISAFTKELGEMNERMTPVKK